MNGGEFRVGEDHRSFVVQDLRLADLQKISSIQICPDNLCLNESVEIRIFDFVTFLD